MNRLVWIYVFVSILGGLYGVQAHVDCSHSPSGGPTEASQAPSVANSPTVKLPELPSATPTESPAPSPPPSATPTQDPSSSPTTPVKANVSPSSQLTIIASPTPAPSSISSSQPTISDQPSLQPSSKPSVSGAPSEAPTTTPSGPPSKSPTPAPSRFPSFVPTTSNSPSSAPSVSLHPSSAPSTVPSQSPSDQPSGRPSSSQEPSVAPSMSPSAIPSDTPSLVPTSKPTQSPTNSPSAAPSEYPSMTPSTKPSSKPSHSMAPSTTTPSMSPSAIPSDTPSLVPSSRPTQNPSNSPSAAPSEYPSMTPSTKPSSTSHPSAHPSGFPSSVPSDVHSTMPSNSVAPSRSPTGQPSSVPSDEPSLAPSDGPTSSPSLPPTGYPSRHPTGAPSNSAAPSRSPTVDPTSVPSDEPSLAPSDGPTSSPSLPPTGYPSRHPTGVPSVNPSAQPSKSLAPSASSQPTAGIRRHQADASVVLNRVSGAMSDLTTAVFETVTLRMLIDLFPRVDDLSIDFFYVQVTSQNFVETGGNRKLQEEVNNSQLIVEFKVVADIMPGYPEDFNFQWEVDTFFGAHLDEWLERLEGASGLSQPQQAQGSPSASSAPSEKVPTYHPTSSPRPSTSSQPSNSASPSASPSLSMSPSVSSSPTASPSAGIRRHQADASVVLNRVSGAMSNLTTAVFETVTLRLLIDLFPGVDDLSIDFFYVQVTDQHFVETGRNRKLQEEVNNGQLIVQFKVVADIMPGDPEDFNFQWVVDTFFGVQLDELLERLEGASGFFQPQQVQGSGSKNDPSVQSNEENEFSTMRILVGLAAATVVAFVAGTLVLRSGRRGHDSSSSDENPSPSYSDPETPTHSWKNFQSFSTVQAGNNRNGRKSEYSNFDGGDEGSTSCGADLTTLGSYTIGSKVASTASPNETASSLSRLSSKQMRRPGSNVIDTDNLERGGNGENDQRDKLGTRLIKRLIKREAEENGDAAGLSMEAILFSKSSLSYNEKSSKVGSVLTMEERASVSTIPRQGSPRDGSIYFDSSRISANSEKKAATNGTRQIFGSRLATWFTGKSPATNDEGDPQVVDQQTTTDGSLQANVNKMRDSSNKKSGEKWNALPTKKQSESTLKKGRRPSALDLHLAQKTKIPLRGDGPKSPNWNEWDCPAGVESPRAEDYDIEESPPKKAQNREAEHASKNLKQKIRDKFRKSRSHEVKVDTDEESDIGESATTMASMNQHISYTHTNELTSPRKLYRVNKEGRLVPNREFQESSPIWVSGDTDQVMGFVHSARKPEKASLASTGNADSEMESPMFSYPPPTLFQFLSEEEPDARRSYPIRSQSRTQQGGRKTYPPTVTHKRDPPPSVTTRSRKSYRRKTMMEMSVENNENAVILGSVDKNCCNLELEWGNTI